MKKCYVKPTLIGENFSVNEFVSACWGVRCNTSEANKIEKYMHNSPIGGHQSQYCGQFSHQYIRTDGSETPTGMEEQKNAWGYNLECTIYTDSTYLTLSDITTVKPGDTIYWTTQASYGGPVQLYHHVGTVQSTYPDNPNRS